MQFGNATQSKTQVFDGPKDFEVAVMQWRIKVMHIVCGPASMMTIRAFVTFWKVTVSEITSEVGISIGRVHTALSDTLGYNKLLGGFRVFSLRHREIWKDKCQWLLNQFEEEEEPFLGCIMTCNKTWVHHYTEKKMQIMTHIYFTE